jgi:hypothetical protein
MDARRSRPGPLALTALLGLLQLLLRAEAVLAGSADLLIRPQGSQTPQMSSRQGSQRSGSLRSLRRQNENDGDVLILPQATREFVGQWGGHLYLLSYGGAFQPKQSSPTSLEFGQRSDGTIFVRTEVWGQSVDGGTHATARVLSPERIRIQVEHVVDVGSQTFRVAQRYSVILKRKGVLDCIESTQVYGGAIASLGDPYEAPAFSANYRGSLLIITDEEAAKLRAELLSRGYVPESSVEGQGNFAPP